MHVKYKRTANKLEYLEKIKSESEVSEVKAVLLFCEGMQRVDPMQVDSVNLR